MQSLKSRLPQPVRRRLGRYRRALLGKPAPAKPAPAAPAPRAFTYPSGTVDVVANPQKPRLQVRREFVFATADPAGLVLEIGPAHNAILPKREGFNTRNVDYLDREGLVDKYRDFKQYNMADIEDVDYVIPAGSSMSDVIEDRFDVVLASHVLEHTTSLVHFVNDCTDLLAEGGVLSLVVPDKRFCFDRFRERSSLGRVIDAYHNPQPVHSRGTLTEFTLNTVKHRGATSWSPGHQGTYELMHDLERVGASAERAETGVYVDAHNWVFTPNHLRLLLRDLYDLGFIRVREAQFQATIGHEFFLNLMVDGSGPAFSREALLALADAENQAADVVEFARASSSAESPGAASLSAGRG
jgi:SAM-dependent methyltransferase